MVEAIFDYKGVNTTIQCNLNDKMKDIFTKFGVKFKKDIN